MKKTLFKTEPPKCKHMDIIAFTNYLKEREAKSTYFQEINPNVLDSIFFHSAGNLLELSPDFIGLELTSCKSIFYVFKRGEITAHIEIFIIDDNEPMALTVLNIYKVKEHLLADSGSYDKSMNQLKEYLPEAPIDFLNRLQSNYALSADSLETFMKSKKVKGCIGRLQNRLIAGTASRKYSGYRHKRSAN